MAPDNKKIEPHLHNQVIMNSMAQLKVTGESPNDKLAASIVELVCKQHPEFDRDKIVAEIRDLTQALHGLIGPIMRITRR